MREAIKQPSKKEARIDKGKGKEKKEKERDDEDENEEDAEEEHSSRVLTRNQKSTLILEFDALFPPHKSRWGGDYGGWGRSHFCEEGGLHGEILEHPLRSPEMDEGQDQEHQRFAFPFIFPLNFVFHF